MYFYFTQDHSHVSLVYRLYFAHASTKQLKNSKGGGSVHNPTYSTHEPSVTAKSKSPADGWLINCQFYSLMFWILKILKFHCQRNLKSLDTKHISKQPHNIFDGFCEASNEERDLRNYILLIRWSIFIWRWRIAKHENIICLIYLFL